MSFLGDVWGWLSGSSGQETQQSQAKTGTNKLEKTTIGSAESGQGKSDVTRTTNVGSSQIFGNANLQVLNDLISTLAQERAAGSGLSGVAQNLVTTSNKLTSSLGGLDIDTIVKQAKDAAELRFSDVVAPTLTAGAMNVGSEFNTNTQQTRLKAERDLATQLGALESDIRLRGAETLSQTGVASAEVGRRAIEAGTLAEAAPLQNLLQALNLAKGAESTTSTEGLSTLDSLLQQVQNTSESTLAQTTIDELLSGQTETEKGSSILDFLNTISLFGGRRGARA